MANDMTKDVFAEFGFGKAALKRMEKTGPLPANFRLYDAENLGKGLGMRVIGAEFLEAAQGPFKGKLSIKMEGTERIAYVSPREIAEAEEVIENGQHA